MPQVISDGKYVRGARRPDGTTLILLPAATPGGVTLAQREIPPETSEVTQTGPMLREPGKYYPLAGHVLTADALHTTRDFADLARDLGAGAVLTVKDNQPTLRAALENALWAHAAVCVTRGKGHGRAETRSHLVMDAPGEVKALFPPAEQVARVVRTRTVTSWLSDGHTRTRVTRTGTETVYLIITMPAREAPPEHIAVCIRRHWSIENRVHYVRDVTLLKTRPRSRPAAGPAPWSPSVTSAPGSSAGQATTRSPPPSAAPDTATTCSSPSRASEQAHEQGKLLCPQPWPDGTV